MSQIDLSLMIKLTQKISSYLSQKISSYLSSCKLYFLFHRKLLVIMCNVGANFFRKIKLFIARAFDWRIIANGDLQFGDSSEILLKAPDEIFIQSNAIYRNYRLWRTQLFLRQRSRWTEFFPAEISPGVPDVSKCPYGSLLYPISSWLRALARSFYCDV